MFHSNRTLQKLPRALGLGESAMGDILTFWDTKFPGRGKGLRHLFWPFEAPRLTLLADAPDPHLEELVRRALFWMRLSGVRVVEPSNMRGLHRYPTISVGESLGITLCCELGPLLPRPASGAIRRALRERCEQNIIRCMEELANSFGELRRPMTFGPLGLMFSESLWLPLMYAGMLHVAMPFNGHRPRDFQPLLDLWWHVHNPPFAVDEDNCALVLCRERTR